MVMPIQSLPPAPPGAERTARRDAPAGSYQAWQAERVRQQAALAPAPAARRTAAGPAAASGAGPGPGPGQAPGPGPGGADPRRPPDGADPTPALPDDAAHDGQPGHGVAPTPAQSGRAGAGAAEVDAGPDPEALAASIAAQAPHQELFALLLPDGRQLGVLFAPGHGGALRVLLASDDDDLRGQLAARRMELERGLAQRMGQAMQVTVL